METQKIRLAVRRAMSRLCPAALVAAAAAATVTGVPDIRVTPMRISFDQQAAEEVYSEIDSMECSGPAQLPSRAVLVRLPEAFAEAGTSLPAADASSLTVVNDGSTDLEVTSLGLDLATPWIEWSPAAPFTVEPGRARRVYLKIDWEQVPAGTTSRRLLIDSNDPDENRYSSGVQLTVHGVGHCSLTTGSPPLS
jgi:hypothetical protein